MARQAPETLVIRRQAQMDRDWAYMLDFIGRHTGDAVEMSRRLHECGGNPDFTTCERLLKSLTDRESVMVVMLAMAGADEAFARIGQREIENAETDRE